MKVNSTSNKDISFNGFWNSKGVKKALTFAADKGALFAATTTLAFSSTVRPLAILAAPKTDKENKKVACAKSLASSLVEFGLTLALTMPVVGAIKKIDKNPAKYLKSNTITSLKDSASNLKESKAYNLATQMFKLGLGIAVTVPKAILTAMGMPIVMEHVYGEKSEKVKNSSNITFEGKNKDWLAKGISKILDNKKYQNFAKKNKDSNFPMHIIAFKDMLATGLFIHEANKNKKIKDERKPAVIYNSLISTGLSITSSYIIDRLTEKPADKIVGKIKQANHTDPNLQKYLDGFKIAKPIMILASVYYLAIPFISTFLAERAEKHINNDFVRKI